MKYFLTMKQSKWPSHGTTLSEGKKLGNNLKKSGSSEHNTAYIYHQIDKVQLDQDLANTPFIGFSEQVLIRLSQLGVKIKEMYKSSMLNR